MRASVLLLSVLLVSASAPDAGAQAPPPVDLAKTRVVVRFAAMDKVAVQENVVFKSVDGADLAMDLYSLPSGGPRPAVVLVSGGTNVRGWGLYRDYGRIVGASDVVAVIPDKRFQGAQGLEQGAQDTLDLLAHLRANASKYNIDAGRICLWTFSAGGSLAQLGIQPENRLTCVVAYYGLGQAGPRLALQQHAAAMPPMLMVRAGRDNPGLNNAIDVFASTALSLNAPLTVLNHPNGVHAFEVEDNRPEPKEPANIAETERILRTTMHWIRQQVGSNHGPAAAKQAPELTSADGRLEGLLQAMGGRAAWAAAEAVKVDATHYSTVFRLPHRNEIWNDFRAPRLRIEATSDEIDRALELDGDTGSRRREAEVRALTAAEVTEQQRWWESNVYRTLHRLARRDPDLSVKMLGPNRLGVFRRDGVRLNWLELNQANEPVLFGTWDSETGTIFGPLTTSPSGLRHSKWAASGDGTWRVELREVSVIPGVPRVSGSGPGVVPGSGRES